ncbi:MAG: fimbrial protein [Leclercia sp.]
MRQTLVFIVGLFALFILRPALADQSCYINTEAEGGYVVGDSPQMVLNPTKVSTPTSLGASYTFVITFRGINPIGCKVWEPFDNSVHFINAAGSQLDTKYTTSDGNALIKTDVPGIDYSLELICSTSNGCGSSSDHGNLSLFLKGSEGTDNVFPSDSSGFPWESADLQWRLRMVMWVTPDFVPQKGVPTGASLSGTLARFQIGASTQPIITFSSVNSTLSFSVPASSCALGMAQGDSVSNNNVALGDYYASDIPADNTRVIPFSLTLENCYTPKLSVKMISSYISPDTTLLGKSSGSATGVGVSIINTDKNVNMKPDGSTSAVYNRTSDWSNQESLSFSAQLKKDGQTIKAGDFNAAATFLLDYE